MQIYTHQLGLMLGQSRFILWLFTVASRPAHVQVAHSPLDMFPL